MFNKNQFRNLVESWTLESIKTAHPLEPFPLYEPKTNKQKVHWFLIVLRWKLIKRFVRYKSFLDGRTFRELFKRYSKISK